jgi:tetratricopeptide (TPR) repeat protein
MRLHNQNLGLIRYCLGQWDLAEENFRRSLQIAVDTNHRQGEAMALMALGRLCRRRRQLDRAEELFRRALGLAVESGARRETALAREFLAEVELNRDNPSAAHQLLEAALAEAVEIAPDGDLVAEIRSGWGSTLLQLGRVDEARPRSAEKA